MSGCGGRYMCHTVVGCMYRGGRGRVCDVMQM